jgi:hypothetical protein
VVITWEFSVFADYNHRARWTQGQVYTWLRARKQTGRGEATSGLGFDLLVEKDGSQVS